MEGISNKEQPEKNDTIMKEVEKKSNLFSLESEISKLTVSIPLTKLVKNNRYKSHTSKMFKVDHMSYMLNVSDDLPELLFGLAVDGNIEDSEVPPFYISLRVHDYIHHNAMMDYGASHNLMLNTIMYNLVLDIIRLYHDLYSFDYGRF